MRAVVVAWAWLALTLLQAARGAAAEAPDFEKQIRPLLVERCAECHGPKTQKGGLRLDARHAALKGGDSGEVIQPGKSDESELIRRISSDDADERMPPKGEALTPAEIALLKQWIDSGANWTETDYDRAAARDRRLDHWAFQSVQAVQPPQIENANDGTPAPANDIDRFIRAKLAQQHLKPSPEADRRTLMRRLWLDLLGLPPTAEQVKAFSASTDPDAWRKLVDEALQSPRYGERWAQHWLDVVRYADTHGFEVNTPRENAWPYRDYVIRALNEDKPYNQFILEQLAGDKLGADEATGFMVASAVLLPGQIGADDESKRQARQDALDEIIVGTGGTFLGLTIGCARCHDHKFDPITARDYYSMQAFFAGVEYGDRPLRNAQQQAQLAQSMALAPKIAEVQNKLQQFERMAFAGRTLLIDEKDPARAVALKAENGPGTNPAGTKRGYKDDVGAADRIGNLSRGFYTWWNNVPGEDVLVYRPGVEGRFRLWLSWGVHGSGVHTRDARYLLDRDGNLATRDDQQELARVDQYYPAGVREGQTEQAPQWSGLLDVGVVELTQASRVVLRGGDTGTGITADVIVLEEATTDAPDTPPGARLPRLRAPVNPKRNIERFAPVTAKFVRLTTLETIENNLHEPCIDELEVFAADPKRGNVALASAGAVATCSGSREVPGRHELRHVNDGQYGNERSWMSSERGAGWVQVAFAEPVEIDRVVWGRDRNGKYQDRLAVRYRVEVSLDGNSWQPVASSTDRTPFGTPHDPNVALQHNASAQGIGDAVTLLAELERLHAEKTKLESTQMVFAGTFRQPDTTFVLRRGNPEQKLDQVAPAIPALFNMPALADTLPEPERRLALARWIASPANPLTARVLVNRIWQNHFGRGLVDTPSDFGLNGAAPSHPELLDYLAGELVRSGWSIKHIHRLILLSATYRQSSTIDPQAAAVDRDNQWVWRYRSRRLEGEAIRDCTLAVSGELNLKMGGPGFSFFKSRGGLDGFPPTEDFTSEELRRMVYSHKVRMEPVPVFGAFDCPDAGQAMPSRGRSTTATQALNLFNSRFVAERSEKFAARMQAAHPNNPEQQVAGAFELALCRAPSAVELAAATEVARTHSLAALCRVLFNSNEFLFLP